MRRVAHEQMAGVFWLVAVSGQRWLWPINHLTEKEWDGTLMDWASKLGRWRKAWHCTVAQKSDPGFFDRVWLRPGKALFTELKVRDKTGSPNTTSTAQDEYIYEGIAAGLDVRVWTFPDDVFEAWVMLAGRTKEECPYYRELAL